MNILKLKQAAFIQATAALLVSEEGEGFEVRRMQGFNAADRLSSVVIVIVTIIISVSVLASSRSRSRSRSQRPPGGRPSLAAERCHNPRVSEGCRRQRSVGCRR